MSLINKDNAGKIGQQLLISGKNILFNKLSRIAIFYSYF